MIRIKSTHSPSRRPSVLMVLLVGFALFAAACGSSDDSVDTGGRDDPGGDDPSGRAIVGEWTITRVTKEGAPVEIPEGVIVTLDLDGEQASGRAACNQYGGGYRVDGDHLVFTDLSWTEMGCEAPLAELEHLVLGVLSASPRVELAGTRLTLTSDTAGLVFEPAPVVEAAPLVGTEWELAGFIEGDVAWTQPEVKRAYLVFAHDGSLGGNAGCNSLRSTWMTDGDSLSVGGVAITRMSCGTQVGEVEQLVLAILADTDRYEIEERRLLVWAGDRALELVARPAAG